MAEYNKVGFEQVVGHHEIINHLQNAILMDKVSHSYIFSGEQGAGKKLLTSLFAMTLQCEEHGKNPCLECDSCKKALSENHPDIIRVYHEKPNVISVDEIRRQVVNDVEIKPYKGPYKIYLINEADKMNVQAQIALLKTIEEPPAYAIIILLTSNADAMLPTIKSRCVTLHLKALSTDLVKEYLMERLHIPDYQAEIDASFAQGNIGRAKEVATSEEFAAMIDRAVLLLKRGGTMQLNELVEMLKELSGDKKRIFEYLDLFKMWFCDVLMFKATMEIDSLVFKNEYNYIREQARKCSYEGLDDIIGAIDKAKVRINANVNFDLTMELLFLTIRETLR